MTPEEIHELAKHVVEYNIESFQGGTVGVLPVFAREILRLHDEIAKSGREDIPATDKIRRYLAIADQVFQIAESNISAETKYALIFSEDLSRALAQIFRLDYYDPDTSYEEDVAAYVSALRARCVELRQIGAAR